MSITHPNLLAQAEAFYWIVRLGGFHAASRHMRLSQPTISARIRELETALGEQLFYRNSSPATLTQAGERAFGFAERILRLTSDLTNRDDAQGGLYGTLHIGAVESMAFSVVPQLMKRVRSELPEMQHAVTVDVATNLAAQLSRQALDLAILSDPPTAPMLESLRLGAVVTRWIYRADLLPGGGRHLTPEILATVPILAHLRSSRLHAHTIEWFQSRNLHPEILVCNSLMLMKHFIEQGLGAALMPLNLIGDGQKTKSLVARKAHPPIPDSSIYLCYNRNRDGAALQKVLSILEEEIRASNALLGGAAQDL